MRLGLYFLFYLLVFSPALALAFDPRAQFSLAGLNPGQSSRADASRVLGEPLRLVSDTVAEYRPPGGTGKLFAQFEKTANIAERFELVFDTPLPRATALAGLNLRIAPTSLRLNTRGKLEERFDGPSTIILLHSGSDKAGPIEKIGYFSPKILAPAGGQSAARSPGEAATP